MPSVPKSYQVTIKHGGGPVTTVLPHNTYTDTMFQVPAGKTWQVIKMLLLIPAPTGVLSSWRVEKASSSGVEQMVLKNNVMQGNSPTAVGVIEEAYEMSNFRDLVLEDQKIFKQIVKVPNSQTFLLFQYEMSVMEFT